LSELLKLGFVKQYQKGFWDGKTKMMSLYKPTETFMSWFPKSYETYSLSCLKPIRELVRLKRDNVLVDYTDTKETKRARSIIKALNRKLSSVDISVDGIQISSSALTYTRAHKNNLQTGGRLYAYVQNTPGVLRRTILFDGEVSIELDYGSLHLSMLYHQAGIGYFLDLYAKGRLVNETRAIVKLAVNIMLNAKNKSSAVKAMLENKIPSPSRLINLILEEHREVSSTFFNSAWKKLQKLDSDLALDVIEHMLTKHNCPVIPVHDSFIVPQKMKDALRFAMESWYGLRFPGFQPNIKP
jgi:hypothetical protein